jgi:hypothetical protein
MPQALLRLPDDRYHTGRLCSVLAAGIDHALLGIE